MTSSTLTQITQLSVSGRIQLVENIWDTIAAEPGRLPVTETQQEELGRRLQALERMPQAGAFWEVVKARITTRSSKVAGD